VIQSEKKFDETGSCQAFPDIFDGLQILFTFQLQNFYDDSSAD